MSLFKYAQHHTDKIQSDPSEGDGGKDTLNESITAAAQTSDIIQILLFCVIQLLLHGTGFFLFPSFIKSQSDAIRHLDVLDVHWAEF